MTTEPHDHEEQGYEGTGLGPADHDDDHRDADSESPEDGGSRSGGHESMPDHRDDRASSVPQENLGDS